jgi:hypothetical protein
MTSGAETPELPAVGALDFPAVEDEVLLPDVPLDPRPLVPTAIAPAPVPLCGGVVLLVPLRPPLPLWPIGTIDMESELHAAKQTIIHQ